MIAEMPPDVGEIGDHIEPILFQMGGGAEARNHQQLRRLDGAAGEDDGAVGVDRPARGLGGDGLAITDDELQRFGPGPHFEVLRQIRKRMQIGDG